MKPLLLELRRELKSLADPSKAPKMQSYMKSTMPYHGVAVPQVRALSKRHVAECDFDSKSWEKSVLYLWRNARFREERYAALYFCEAKKFADFQTLDKMKMYEELIVSGACWDFVDTVSHRVGFILRRYPKPMKAKMLSWSRSSNLWKRRTSIICQLDFGMETDLDLLYACIEPSLGSKEFFLQKGIGWALRQYAWKKPAEVKRYVKANWDRLAPLSRREALKNL